MPISERFWCVYSCIQQIFIIQQCARHCLGYWIYNREQNSHRPDPKEFVTWWQRLTMSKILDKLYSVLASEKENKIKQRKGIGWCRGLQLYPARGNFSEKITFEESPERGEGTGHEDTWGKSSPGSGAASAKVPRRGELPAWSRDGAGASLAGAQWTREIRKLRAGGWADHAEPRLLGFYSAWDVKLPERLDRRGLRSY